MDVCPHLWRGEDDGAIRVEILEVGGLVKVAVVEKHGSRASEGIVSAVRRQIPSPDREILRKREANLRRAV